MVGVIFLEQFDINRQWYWLILPLTAIAFILIGYFLKRLNIFQKDMGYRTSENPYMRELMRKVDNIEKKL